MYSDNDTIIGRILKGDDSFVDFGFTTLLKVVLGSDIRELQVVFDATADTLNIPDLSEQNLYFLGSFLTMPSMSDYSSRMVQIRCERHARF